MQDIAIKVENLSKLYRIGVKDRGLLSERIAHSLKSLVSKNGKAQDAAKFWALRDISFEIKKGEAVGIIGKNGAGKSTLLKIISRITEPTTGRVKINGRVASLLEVGTGFHSELTGRENIYMNGAILGMKRAEIKRKFDEIVEFSGIEKFIDTPVKHYSSGMVVRLGFAVAAHLEPEILVVDEVLAVGDMEFQKKCLGKMQDVAKNEGRTVLFVSHSMTAISSLCTRAMLLEKGFKAYDGDTEQAIGLYLTANSSQAEGVVEIDDNSGVSRYGNRSFVRLMRIELTDEMGNRKEQFAMGETMKVRIHFELSCSVENLEVGFLIANMLNIPLTGFVSAWEGLDGKFPKGYHIVEACVPNLSLLPSTYGITVWAKRQGEGVDDQVDMPIRFSVVGKDITGYNPYFERYNHLGIFQRSSWQKIEEKLCA